LTAYEDAGSDPNLPGGVVPADNANFYRVPTLMMRNRQNLGSGSGISLQSNQVFLFGGVEFDAAGGSSGGGLIQTLFSAQGDQTLCWVGSVIGPSSSAVVTSGPTSSRLTFRALTAGTWGFIAGNSNEF